MKNVMFQGNMYSVPEWAKWIARDASMHGYEVWAYDEEPELINGMWSFSGKYPRMQHVDMVKEEEFFPVECMPIPSENV